MTNRVLKRSRIVSCTGAILFFVSWCNGFNIHFEHIKNLCKPKNSNDDIVLVQANNPRRQIINSLVKGGSGITPLVLSTTSMERIKSCNALSPEEAAIQYDTYATTYDNLDGGIASSILGIDDARQSMISQAKGNVLEIGVGTGMYCALMETKIFLLSVNLGLIFFSFAIVLL
jgi:hypothetical protein